jgi:hypothetical protein
VDRDCRRLRLHDRQRNIASERGLIRRVRRLDRDLGLIVRAGGGQKPMRDVLTVISLALFAFGLFVIFATKGTPVEFLGTGCILASVLTIAIAAWWEGGP